MKKIFGLFTQSLLALLLIITPLFSPSLFAATEAENLEAWAKMYEDMNQASGGEIEALMKEMEKSGELDALMKELEQSGELDKILDSMVKTTPQEYLETLERELETERATATPAPVTRPESQPTAATTKPTAPATPILQVDKSKLKQVQALLHSIVSKIAAIRQKAAIRTSVQKELSPWEYNLTDLTYYLTLLEDETLAKYLQQPEFTNLYNNLITLNNSLSVEEPRLQVEEMLEVGFEDPYLTLGFAASNISEAEVEKRYTELETQKNPFAVKNAAIKAGLSPREVELEFKKAQQESDRLFEAYKRIKQKETSARAFLAILQAFHKAIYKDMLIEDVKKLLRQYDPEALKIKEAQEAKEKEARDYRARVASQKPEYLPPIFDWSAFGEKKTPETKAPTKPSSGPYQRKEYEAFEHEKGRIQVPQPEKPGAKGKEGKKEEDKKKEEKKEGEKGKEVKKEGEKGKDAKQEAIKQREKKTNDLIKQIEALKPIVTGVTEAFSVFFGNAPVVRQVDQEGRLRQNVEATLEPMKKLKDALHDFTKQLKDNIKKAKDKDEKEAAEKELTEFHKKIQKAFNDNIAEEKTLKPIIDKVFNNIDDAGNPTNIQLTKLQRDTYFQGAPTLMQKFQDGFGNLFFTANDTVPLEIMSELSEVGKVVQKNKKQLNDVFTLGINQVTGPIIEEVSKKLTAVSKDIEEKKKKNTSTPLSAYYKLQLATLLPVALQDISPVLKQYKKVAVPTDPTKPVTRSGVNIPVYAAYRKPLEDMVAAYKKINDNIPKIPFVI